MIDAEAQTNNQLAHEQDDEAKSDDETTAGHESDALIAEAAADQTQGNGDAAAEAAFQIAQANETSTVWNWLAGQLGNTPWAVSQAGLAGAEAAWAPTAAANYQTYVSALGTAETAYAASNAEQFVTEIDSIDDADDLAANTAADDGLTLTDALTGDEAALEETLSPAGAAYQEDVAQAQHDFRQAVAQADHDLAVGTLTDYAGAIAAATSAQTAGYAQAYGNFSAAVSPAITLQETDDANAELTDSDDDAAANLTDIDDNNQAVDTYDDAESTDFDTQQKAEAQALQVMQAANASGHLAAIDAFDANYPPPPGEGQGEGNPWADLAAAQAAALAAQQTSQADALLTQSNAQADAQEIAEQARADALSSEDDADAQAEDTQETTDAQADHDQAMAQAAVADDVSDDLPDTLIAPTDGPDQTLSADFKVGYEANDFYLPGRSGDWESPWQGLIPEQGLPNFMVCSFETQGVALPGPDAAMPWGRIGGSAAIYSIELYGLNDVINNGLPPYGNPQPYGLIDLVRGDSLPISGVFGPAMHFSGPSADLLDISKAPSAVGPGGFSSSPLPTTTAGTQLANPSATSLAPAPMSLSAPASSGTRQVAGMQSGAEGENGEGNTTAPETPQQPNSTGEDSAASGGSDSSDASARPAASAIAVIIVLPKGPDPAQESPNEQNRAAGEPEKPTGQTQQQLSEADKKAQALAATLATPEQRAAAAAKSRQELVDELGREPTSKELYKHQRNRAMVAIDNLGGVSSELGADIFVAFVSPEVTSKYREEYLNDDPNSHLSAKRIAKSVITTAATGAVIVVAAGAAVATGPVGIVVVVGLSVAGVGKVAYDRAADGQSGGQVIVGTLGDITGVSGIVAGAYDTDLATQRVLSLTSGKRSEALGTGGGQVLLVFAGQYLSKQGFSGMNAFRKSRPPGSFLAFERYSTAPGNARDVALAFEQTLPERTVALKALAELPKKKAITGFFTDESPFFGTASEFQRGVAVPYRPLGYLRAIASGVRARGMRSLPNAGQAGGFYEYVLPEGAEIGAAQFMVFADNTLIFAVNTAGAGSALKLLSEPSADD